MSEYFFHNIKEEIINNNNNLATFIKLLDDFSNSDKRHVYFLAHPLMQKEDLPDNDTSFFLVSNNMKVIFINFSDDKKSFGEYIDDVISELYYLVKKYKYVELLRRPRDWDEYYEHIAYNELEIKDINDINEIFNKYSVNVEEETGRMLSRKIKVLVSLAIGSINDNEIVGLDLPLNLIDEIKKQIKLLDALQTDFIYSNKQAKRIKIQGLAGTGKTELLIRKLLESFENMDNPRLAFTCHNRVLADTLRKRVPDIFDFMKVEKQIKWNENMFIFNSWGSLRYHDKLGLYSYICKMYNLRFYGFRDVSSFSEACRIALEELKNKETKAKIFDYIFIDEGQDFDENFFLLCEEVTSNTVFIGEDIFQDIFEQKSTQASNADYLLNKCYRTDPKTLMFAHAFTLGLFFKEKRQWFSDEDWKRCGYTFERRDNDMFYLTREPIQRFEELNNYEYDCIDVYSYENKNISDIILDIITDIKNQNETVKPDDIGIVFTDNVYDHIAEINLISSKLHTKFDWHTNLAYDTKECIADKVFLSNINNVKGLEFPFTIVISSNYLYANKANSIYMALTRSFISSYLLIPRDGSRDTLKNKISQLKSEGGITTKEPNEQEKEAIKRTLYSKNSVDLDNVRKEILFSIKSTYEDSANDTLNHLLPQFAERLKTNPTLTKDEIISTCKNKIIENINSNLLENNITEDDLYE